MGVRVRPLVDLIGEHHQEPQGDAVAVCKVPLSHLLCGGREELVQGQ